MVKYRKSFVTNSSSSSYICDVCGEDASGWDMTLSEANMYECENGHVFCEDHADSFNEREMVIELVKQDIKKYSKYVDEYKEKGKDNTYYLNLVNESQNDLLNYQNDTKSDEFDWDELLSDMDFRYNVPASICPICNFSELTDSDATAYMLYKYGVSAEQLKKEIRENFGNYSEFKKEIEK
jgi:hypothetical protein